MDRRVKAGFIDKIDSMRWLQGKTRIINLPDDAYISGFFHDWMRDSLGIYIHSNTFPEVATGQALEIIDLIVSSEPGIFTDTYLGNSTITENGTSVTIGDLSCTHDYRKRDYGSWCAKCGDVNG